MEYVLDEKGNIKIGPGKKPLVKGDDGKEFEIDAIGAQGKIDTITAESNDRRKKLGEANTKLETFKGIEDPAAAIDALQKVGSIDTDKQVEMDTLKDTINKTWGEKETAWNTEKETLNSQLFDAKVGSQFALSKAVKTTVLPPTVAKDTFGKHFMPDGTATGHDGKQIFSKEKPGEPAGFEESMSVLIDTHPDRDNLLRASSTEGGGGYGSGGGTAGDNLTALGSIKAGLAARGIK